MRPAGLRLYVILILLMAGMLLGVNDFLSSAETNLANTYLLKGLIGSAPVREQYQKKFLDWAMVASRQPTLSPVALYGMGIVSLDRDPSPLFASRLASELWESGGSRNRGRGRLLLDLVGCRLTKVNDIRLVARMFDESVAFSWLASSARVHWGERNVKAAGAFLQVMSEANEFPPNSFLQTRELADLYADVGWEQWSLGLNHDAINSFDRALMLAPDNANALIFKGYVLRSLGEINEGLRLTRLAIILHPDNFETWHFWGVAMASIGKLTEAENALRQSMELEHGNSWVKLDLARILLQEGRQVDALPYAQEAAMLATDHNSQVVTLQFLGDLYWSLGDTVQASDTYRRLVALDPGTYDRLKERLGLPIPSPN